LCGARTTIFLTRPYHVDIFLELVYFLLFLLDICRFA